MGKHRRKVAYPCSVCEKACGQQTILCSACGLWVHAKCVPLSDTQFSEYANKDEYFICPLCAKDQSGLFDFEKSLQRYVHMYTRRTMYDIVVYFLHWR